MTLSVIDSIESCEFSDGISYTWTGYTQERNKFSLLKLIEENGDYYKSKYLNWIHAAGKYSFRGKSLVDHFIINDDFSYWWMMPITEKSIWKSTYITDIIRLMALEDLISQYKPSSIRLCSKDRLLNEVLSEFCQRKKIEYKWHKLPKLKVISLVDIFLRLPLPVRALLSAAKYLTQRWALGKQKNVKWFSGDKSIFFCSYFFNLDPVSLQNGEYRSRYWGDLHKLISGLGLKSNWLQLYHEHPEIPNAEVAKIVANKFNKGNNEVHAFLDSNLSVSVIWKVFKNIFQLTSKASHLGSIKEAFRSEGSEMSFFPLIREEWNNSLYGPIAVSNLLYYHLFEKAISKLPHQNKGFYISENQAWERVFIHSWYKFGHGNLIAVAHATVRFWDMRYSSDSRLTDQSYSENFLPFPDFVALNGKAAFDNYFTVEYPIKSIKECEALRFSNINQKGITTKRQHLLKDSKRVLILGDYLPRGTENIMKLLQETMHLLPENLTFTIKPHPAHLVSIKDYPLLKLDIVSDALEDLLSNYDIAYASNFTSASVDAYITGMRIVVFLDDNQLNVSPLRSRDNVIFVNTPEQLAKAFTNKEAVKQINSSEDFFFLDPKLPQWNKILTEN